MDDENLNRKCYYLLFEKKNDRAQVFNHRGGTKYIHYEERGFDAPAFTITEFLGFFRVEFCKFLKIHTKNLAEWLHQFNPNQCVATIDLVRCETSHFRTAQFQKPYYDKKNKVIGMACYDETKCKVSACPTFDIEQKIVHELTVADMMQKFHLDHLVTYIDDKYGSGFTCFFGDIVRRMFLYFSDRLYHWKMQCGTLHVLSESLIPNAREYIHFHSILSFVQSNSKSDYAKKICTREKTLVSAKYTKRNKYVKEIL